MAKSKVKLSLYTYGDKVNPTQQDYVLYASLKDALADATDAVVQDGVPCVVYKVIPVKLVKPGEAAVEDVKEDS